MKPIRVVRILETGEEDIEFKDLKSGDKFKMFNLDGTQVVGEGDKIEFTAACDAYLEVDDNGGEGAYTIAIR